VVALRDEDGDGRADRIERFGAEGGNGIAYASGALYFAPDDKVVRYALDQFVPSSAPVTIVSGLPASPDHYAKSILVRGDALFVNIGSSSNACQVENRIPHSPGLDPCPELSTRAGVWKFARDEQGQSQRDGERFVSGTRNANALALDPRDGELYAVLNGRDQLYDNWPELYSQRDDALAPAEELLRLKKSANYGWPYCYYEPRLAKKVLAPEYGGDGLIEGRCSVYELPIASLPADWAPLGMSFYEGTSFPAPYRDGAFIASHGSRFAPNASGSLPGYNVVFQPFRRGQPTGQYTEFATGFAGDGRPLPEAARYRPVGVAQGPDGSLYISDDKVGRIWRVIAIRA
jgi:glucose/arabinose dehydrogenase